MYFMKYYLNFTLWREDTINDLFGQYIYTD